MSIFNTVKIGFLGCLVMAAIFVTEGAVTVQDPPPSSSQVKPASTAPAGSSSQGGTASPQRSVPRVQEAPAPVPNVLGLQLGRRSSSISLSGVDGSTGATLVNLAPAVGAWFILQLSSGAGPPVYYHLENVAPDETRLALVSEEGGGIRFTTGGRSTVCAPWKGGANSELAQAKRSGSPFSPICDERLQLRNPATGRRSNIERVTDFLRDRVKGGEAITVFVRGTVFKDKYLQTGMAERANQVHEIPEGAPPPVAISPRFASAVVPPAGLALSLEDVDGGRLEVGRWYRATGTPGVFVSTLQPGQVPGLGEALKGTVSPLDEVEAGALTYLVAFDMSLLKLGFALGTDHPRLGWSDRVPEADRVPNQPGPDGFADVFPLVRTGQLAPQYLSRVLSTFTGGFKRSHGAFKWGDLAQRNNASHYGFIEEGTILSRLQPGLATVVVWKDGQADLLTWQRELDARLGEIRYARQNGVPIVMPDAVTGMPRPGDLVTRWGAGNWSGSEDEKLRSLRAGLCQINGPEGNYIVYGYFSGATPSAMARVFLAAGCNYGIHLDMNALEHTYLALYRTSDERFVTEHLIAGMTVLDPEKDNIHLPRFVAVPDNRDFFYVLRREEK